MFLKTINSLNLENTQWIKSFKNGRFSRKKKILYIYSLGASRLEVFDTETRAPKRTCSFDVETNELINIEHSGNFLVATKIKNDQDLNYQLISFHMSENEKPEKFFHQELKIKKISLRLKNLY